MTPIAPHIEAFLREYLCLLGQPVPLPGDIDGHSASDLLADHGPFRHDDQ